MQNDVRKPIRANKDVSRAGTISMPKKANAPEPDSDTTAKPILVKSDQAPIQSRGQALAPLGRYRLQVDRQTKASFASMDEAEKAGKAIKKAHPVVQVAVYDAEQSAQTLLD